MKLIAKDSAASKLFISSSKQGDDDPAPEKSNSVKKKSVKIKPQPRMMRTLEFCIISAQDLKSTAKFGRMRCYAVASICPDYRLKVSTRIDRDGGINPTWDAKLTLEVEESVFASDEDRYPHPQLTIQIYSRGSLRDKLVGTVRILVGDAVRERKPNMRSVVNRFPVVPYLVFRPRGDTHGILNVCIPPGGRFPERTDSISFARAGEDGGGIPVKLCAPLMRDEENECLVANLVSPPKHTLGCIPTSVAIPGTRAVPAPDALEPSQRPPGKLASNATTATGPKPPEPEKSEDSSEVKEAPKLHAFTGRKCSFM